MAEYFDVDPAARAPCICACCGWDVESKQGCQCPECHECGEQGNPRCYEDPCCGGHNMEYNEIQKYGMAKRREMDEQDRKQAQAQMEDEQRAKELVRAYL